MKHVLTDMQNSPSSWPFAKPVNKDEVADYYIVIKEPMGASFLLHHTPSCFHIFSKQSLTLSLDCPPDLATMELKLESNMYPTMAEFLYDANLIFQNCRQYNPETSTYVKNANKLEKYMKERGALSSFLILSHLFECWD
jgi:histone acetyltransferase